MFVWRICKEARASTAFDGEGARRYPGRWNEKGTAIVYTASSLSLATLEVFVHLDPDELPDDLVAIRCQVPDGIAIERLEVAKLPGNWRAVPAPATVQALGSRWVAAATSAVLVVPSAVTPGENNVLLNPAHSDMAKLVIDPPQRFAFDRRMRK